MKMRGLSLCLLGKAPHIKSSVLQKDWPPITMIIIQLMCKKKSILFLLFQDPHVNAFFQQCQKREKDMSQSPTSNFVRSCKVTWRANSCSGLQDGNGQNRPLHFALSSKLQGNHSWRFLNTLSIPRRNYFVSQFLKGVCLYNGTISKDQFLQNKNDWKSESIDSKLVN